MVHWRSHPWGQDERDHHQYRPIHLAASSPIRSLNPYQETLLVLFRHLLEAYRSKVCLSEDRAHWTTAADYLCLGLLGYRIPMILTDDQ